MDPIDYEDDVVSVFLKVDHREMPRYVISMRVSFEGKELSLHMRCIIVRLLVVDVLIITCTCKSILILKLLLLSLFVHHHICS